MFVNTPLTTERIRENYEKIFEITRDRGLVLSVLNLLEVESAQCIIGIKHNIVFKIQKKFSTTLGVFFFHGYLIVGTLDSL